ncbi:hypothetical protein Godav_009452, partial [Gossypium davidsonii]|nr:hypothetical protein [Gossypium davidsonii]
MKFAVKAWSNGGARAGILHLGTSTIDTPSLLLSTRKGLPHFISPDLLSCLPSPEDSIQCLPEANSTNKIGASFETPCGRLLIKPVEYTEMISSTRPELWATLADEVPAWVSDKRNKTSVDRTIKWLDECISLSPASGAVFGAIVGGSSLEERRRCAQEVATRKVSGYWVGGLGLGESMDERPALLNAVIEALPEEKPRLICGLGLP